MSPDIEAGKRSWVFEALMMLVEKKPYNKITMEDIAKKAGISRQTLYRLFTDKDDIISQFLTAAADSGLLSIESEHESGKPDTIVILCNAEFVGKHYGVLKKMLADAHIHDLISSLTKEKLLT
jgi:AcrR family transcriptional regulator